MAFFIDFWIMSFVNYNGKWFQENEPLFTAANRGFKYGDGLFETMKAEDGKIALAHFIYKG